MRTQVVYKPRPLSYDLDWLDAFRTHAQAQLISEPERLDADLVVILHSLSAQWAGYPKWLISACQERRGKLVIFHANEFKDIEKREAAAIDMGADYIATQLPDGRLYSMPTISMPHALNETVFRNSGIKRTISVGFRGSKYKPGINDDRNAVIASFKDVLDADIVLDRKKLFGRDEWASYLNHCKATVGAEAGALGARIISPRHLEAIGCGTLQVLLPGEYCGVLDERHYLAFTSVGAAMDVILDDAKRNEVTDRALTHIREHHTYRHRIEHLMSAIA